MSTPCINDGSVKRIIRIANRTDSFWARVNKTDSCWLWTGYKTKRNYGQLSANGRARFAHRFAYELLVGLIPEGLWVLHRCDNPPCVNPDHLFLGTVQDNNADCVAKGRHDPLTWRLAANKAHLAKTHCPQGHPYLGANLYTNPKGGRVCRICMKARDGVRRISDHR